MINVTRGGNTTETYLPLRGTEHAVGASTDDNDSLHLVHLGLHQAGLDGLQDPVLHIVVPRHLKSVRHHLFVSTSGKHHKKIQPGRGGELEDPGAVQRTRVCYTFGGNT